MNIAIFRNDLTVIDLSSYNSQELGLAKGMSALGHSVDIYSVSNTNQQETIEVQSTPTRIRFILLPYWKIPVLDAPVFKYLGKSLSAGSYDLVQINDEGSVAAFQLARACSKRKVPYIVYQGMYKLLSGRSRAIYEKLHHTFFRSFIKNNAQAVFTKTSIAKKYLDSKGFDDVSVVPIGIDLSAFSNEQPNDWKAEFGISDKKRILLYVGVLEPRRRPHFLLDLASELGSQYQLVIAGEGPLKDEVVNRAKASGIENVTFLGKLTQSQLPNIYQQSDVLLLPSNFEIYGMVVLEALFFGLPVISSATAGPSDILNDDRLGRIVSEFDVPLWTNAITNVIESGHESEFVEYRKAEVNNRFNWKNIAKNYLDLAKRATKV